MARATANARATIESLAHAWRAYSFCHEPFTSGGTFTHLVSSQLPEVTPPVLAPRSIPPSPAALGLRCARSEKPNLPQQKVTSRYRGAVVTSSIGNSSQLPKKAAPDRSHLLPLIAFGGNVGRLPCCNGHKPSKLFCGPLTRRCGRGLRPESSHSPKPRDPTHMLARWLHRQVLTD